MSQIRILKSDGNEAYEVFSETLEAQSKLDAKKKHIDRVLLEISNLYPKGKVTLKQIVYNLQGIDSSTFFLHHPKQ